MRTFGGQCDGNLGRAGGWEAGEGRGMRSWREQGDGGSRGRKGRMWEV